MYLLAFTAILSGLLDFTGAQCNGTALQISSGDATIDSPNYFDEYGKSANCTWNFKRPTNGNHLLQLTIKTMKLYFEDSNMTRYCPPGAYELAIAGEMLDCTRFVSGSDTAPSFCIAFNSSCIGEQSPCESVRSFPSEFEVTYNSNGETAGDQNVWGFRIEYSYMDCFRTTTASTQTLVVETSIPTHGELTARTSETSRQTDRTSMTARGDETSNSSTASSPTSASEAHDTVTLPRDEITPTGNEVTNETATNKAGTPRREEALAIGLGVAVGIFVVVAIVIAGYWLWKRRKFAASDQAVAFSNTADTPEGQYENETIMPKSEKVTKPTDADLDIYVNEGAARHPAALKKVENGYKNGYNDDIQL